MSEKAHYVITAILFLIINYSTIQAMEKQIDEYKLLNTEQIKRVDKGDILVDSIVKSTNLNGQENQSLDFFSAGLHPKSCLFAMRKLSLYENYTQYLNFITKSSYDEKKEIIDLTIEHSVLPIKMGLIFKIPRIKNVGTYPFSFDQGFLKDLKGIITLSETSDKRCLFTTTAHWSGPHSGYNNLLFELFSTTLSRLAMGHLFRISTTY